MNGDELAVIPEIVKKYSELLKSATNVCVLAALTLRSVSVTCFTPDEAVILVIQSNEPLLLSARSFVVPFTPLYTKVLPENAPLIDWRVESRAGELAESLTVKVVVTLPKSVELTLLRFSAVSERLV